MRSTLALLLAAGLTLSAADAQNGTPQPPAPPAAQPETPPAPKPVPVPDGPVLEKKELEGGLILEDITIGTGYEVKPGGAVVAHYHGTLKADGKEFDSSFNRGEPAAFPLNGVIEGWGKGVPGMKIGGVRRLTIPAAMAYGERSPSAEIPANSDLVFVIQLVDAMQIEDTKIGEGDPATGQCVAVTTYSIKDADGKETEKADASKPYIWLPNEYQPMQIGLDGMKVGGTRKLTVPKEFNLSNPQLAANRVSNVPVTIEVSLLAVRNLPGGRRR